MRFDFGFADNPGLLAFHGPVLIVQVGFDPTWSASHSTPPSARGVERTTRKVSLSSP